MRPNPWTIYCRRQLAEVDVAGRWTPGRKSALIELIRRGDLSEAQACARYGISLEELTAWREAEQAHGRRGLSVTKIQEVGRHG